MRRNFGAKPYTYPQPVFMIATYGEDGVPDVMNAAWGGISNDTEISLCIGANHKTTENFLKRRAFTISMADVEHLAACDYAGLVSGNNVPDKFARAGFTASRSDFVDAPIINELAVAIECRLISYDENTCRLVGEIVNVSVDERVLDEAGNVDVSKVEPITFDPFNNTYVRLGRVAGKAFKDGTTLKQG
ncbi:flavin reductase family protein [Ruminococcus sp. OA3]|uniref:flavin reductase family protein n=1 Tax=Ruminococcus sp. OA3 TaxID=2914164 RepID=UPI001F06864E|nr:flavin reductase family protein [Ruminococcus sp. OA3]MCH1982083.1 flavin reductase family protein [Ruminococcus sp. OA3]